MRHPGDLLGGGLDETVAAEVVIGDNNETLETGVDTVTIVAVTPVDEPVRLEVVDDGRTQSIDLRTGEPGDDAIEGFRTEAVDQLSPYRAAGTLQGPALVPEIPVMVDIELGGARRVPWVAGEGYAEEGRAWLLVEVKGFSVEGDPPLAPIAGGLATDGTLTIVDEAGAEHPASPGLLEPIDVASGGTTASFDVPETFTTGTLRITPGANLMYSNPTSGIVGPPWHTPPPAQDIVVILIERTL